MTVHPGRNLRRSPQFLLLGKVFQCARVFLARIAHRHSLKWQHVHIHTQEVRVAGVDCSDAVSVRHQPNACLGKGLPPTALPWRGLFWLQMPPPASTSATLSIPQLDEMLEGLRFSQ